MKLINKSSLCILSIILLNQAIEMNAFAWTNSRSISGLTFSQPLLTHRMQPLMSSKKEDAELSNGEISRYSRHLVLGDVGVAGQKALKNASVLVIGAGGLGSPCLMYLAAAGVGHIGIVVSIMFLIDSKETKNIRIVSKILK